MAYYYQGLSLLGAWDSGFQDYALGSSGPAPIRVPTGGYFVQAGYTLTGETIRDRTLIDPLRPFDLRAGHFGLGAFEVTARFSELELGRQVFTGGLANGRTVTWFFGCPAPVPECDQLRPGITHGRSVAATRQRSPRTGTSRYPSS